MTDIFSALLFIARSTQMAQNFFQLSFEQTRLLTVSLFANGTTFFQSEYQAISATNVSRRLRRAGRFSA